MQNRYFDFLISSSFQVINRLFVLWFENEKDLESYKKYYLSTVEIKDYNIAIDGINFFDQIVKNNLRTYDNIWKIATGRGDDYTTRCLLGYLFFEKYKLTAIDLCKQQKIDAGPKAIQQINFTWNLNTAEGATNIFHYWWGKRNSFRFFKRNS